MAEDIGIFQEIDDALRVDNMEKLLRRYGKLIIVVCVGIVLATAGSVLWKSHQREGNMQKTAVLLQVQELKNTGKYPEAIKALEEAMRQNKDIPVVKKFQYAGLLVQSGQPAKAEAVYNEIAGDSNNDSGLRDFAAMNAAIIAANNGTLARQKLDTGSGQPFYAIATELTALRLEKEGKNKEAYDMLENLAADMSLSTAEHQRAVELLAGAKGNGQ